MQIYNALFGITVIVLCTALLNVNISESSNVPSMIDVIIEKKFVLPDMFAFMYSYHKHISILKNNFYYHVEISVSSI